MITSSDSFTTYDLGKYFVILPQLPCWDLKEYISSFNAVLVPIGFNYTSGNNDKWETIDSLRKLIIEHVDPTFKPF